VDLGEVLGDVNIGNYTLRIGTLNGGVVNLAPPEHTSAPPQPRPGPVMLLPRAFSGFLDRREEVSAAAPVLQGASPVEFHGPPGVGKTALLHYLAHYKFGPVFPDGVVFFSEIRHRPVDDLLLDFFDAFYERDPAYIPTRVQVRHALREERALVVLDDVDLGGKRSRRSWTPRPLPCSSRPPRSVACGAGDAPSPCEGYPPRTPWRSSSANWGAHSPTRTARSSSDSTPSWKGTP
jgi:hypothetical protein